ncbi:uncharacterized protein PHALS_01773 [Plasmopara halstedii]|uniref:Uncharacterized protein n=1 Tax=Plasmopara halstedii TaxID=4781 RepID=A0A0P1AW67_PLAHL|nr:uncharacterized protein PHALS_01773 [Plasmopara halstedii]CEG45481.1 hypothetical protein PHALS_01773 [Plasmopara halstedii]|eukprot:XP_024581850.1 hypothetical protein PHALS_01773 [Plasmopara halstedii]
MSYKQNHAVFSMASSKPFDLKLSTKVKLPYQSSLESTYADLSHIGIGDLVCVFIYRIFDGVNFLSHASPVVGAT